MSATLVTGSVTAGVNFTASAVIGLAPQGQTLNLPSLVNLLFSSGNAAALKIDQFYQVTGTITANNAGVDIDLYALAGALDAGGNAFTMATVKYLAFLNYGVPGATLEADYIMLGGKGSTAGWTSPFNANTDKLKVYSGPATATNPTPTPGFVILSTAGATGMVVGASTTNHILTLSTPAGNSGTCSYSLILAGAKA